MRSKPIHQFKSCCHTGICSLSQTHINMSTLPISPLTAMRIMSVMDCICFFALCSYFVRLLWEMWHCHERWARWELAAIPMTNSLTLPIRNISSCVVLNTCLDLHGPPDWKGVSASDPPTKIHAQHYSIVREEKQSNMANWGTYATDLSMLTCDWPK